MVGTQELAALSRQADARAVISSGDDDEHDKCERLRDNDQAALGGGGRETCHPWFRLIIELLQQSS
jgi:hypothetical protein